MLHAIFSDSDSDHELTDAHAPQPNPNKRPLTYDDFNWDYWTPTIPAPAKQPKYENQVEDVQQPNPGPLSPKPADEDLETGEPQILKSSGVYPSSNPALGHASSAASQGPYYPSMDFLGHRRRRRRKVYGMIILLWRWMAYFRIKMRCMGYCTALCRQRIMTRATI